MPNDSISAGAVATTLPGRLARRGIISNFLAVTVFTCAVKALGGAKSIFSARVFGLSHELDCFLVAFALASLVCETIAGSLTAALVPQIVKIRLSEDAKLARSSYGTLLYTALLALAGMSVVIASTDRLAFHFIAAGFSPSDLKLTHNLLTWMLPMFPATAVLAIWRALLNSEDRFSLAAAAPAFTPAAILLFLFAGQKIFGIYSLSLGVSTGALAEVCALAFGIRQLGFAVFPRFGFRLPREWFLGEYLPLMATTLVGGSRMIVDQSVAATMGMGSVSLLNLGTRVAAFVTSIGPTAAGAVLLPALSNMVGERDWDKLRNQLRKVSLSGCAIACVCSLAAMAASPALAYLLLQKGSSQYVDVAAVARVQTLSFTQFPFAFLSVVLTRLAVAAGLSRKLMMVSVVGAVLNVVLDLVFARQMGIAGIALSTTALFAATSLLLALSMRRLGAVNGRFTSSSQSVGN